MTAQAARRSRAFAWTECARRMRGAARGLALAAMLATGLHGLAGCSVLGLGPDEAHEEAGQPQAPQQQPSTPSVTMPPAPALPVGRQASRMQAVAWTDLPGWEADNLVSALPAVLSGCRALARRPEWARTCQLAAQIDPFDGAAIRAFFERNFVPHALANDDGTRSGLITGYYEPQLRGARTRQGIYQVPLHVMPPGLRGRKLPARAELLRSGMLRGHELVWVDDPVEAAFLQIQGSGRIELAEGGTMRVGFGGTNDQPFMSIGRWLLDRGEITPVQATMQGIKAWARANPARVTEMLDANPRYVFFREMPADSGGPIGSLGVPLTAERSIAVDPSAIPMGAPVYLATTRPLSNEPLRRLMLAQDTGTAIRGVVRADFFWGFGAQAGEQAGRMKQQGQMWVLLPRQGN